jgi:secondary thiamine-phosphate synthase enzyme
MLRTDASMRTTALELDTRDRRVIDITREVAAFCSGTGDGLVNVFVPHATAGIAIMETGSGSEADLDEVLGRLLPRDGRYAHQHGPAGHGGDHLLPVFVSPSTTIPVASGRLQLGTWQRVVVVDPNRDNNRRSVLLSFVEG